MDQSRRDEPLESIDIARKVVDAALEKQASDILLLDVRGICSFTDYFVICTGESERQLRAIGDEITRAVSAEGIAGGRMQGDAASGWLILDFGSVVAHIFSPSQREFYKLEEMWQLGSQVLKIQ